MVGFLRALRLMFCLDMYLGVSMEVRGRSAVHHRENDGRSPSITLPDDPSMTMNICFPLCAYSMNHTGAWSNSPSYVVGYTWIDSRLSTRVFACFSANLWASAAAWDFASASVTSPLWTSTPPVWRLSKFILFCNWNWNPSSGWYFTYPRTATIGMLYCIWMRSRTRITCGCVLTCWFRFCEPAAAAAIVRANNAAPAAFFAPESPWAIIPTPAPVPTLFVPWKSATTEVGTIQYGT